MKISRLFHWLYAFLMLLPIFVIPAFYFYSERHDLNTSDEPFVVETRKYSTNEVVYNNGSLDLDSIINGNTYLFTYTAVLGSSSVNTAISDSGDYLALSGLHDDNLTWVIRSQTSNPSPINLIGGYYYFSSGTANNPFYNEASYYLDNNPFVITIFDKSHVYFNNLAIGTFSILTDEYNPIVDSFIDRGESSIMNVFLNDLTDSINNNPLFSWSKNTFLTEPFYYITDLFNVPHDSPINTLFSYWLAISIIYLVFDILMYVPLLCHNWIDKGRIE